MGRGHWYISGEGKAFRIAVGRECCLKGVKAITGNIALSIHAYPPDRRARDLDNLFKAILDACQHCGCYANDSQIKHLTGIMDSPDSTPRVEVQIESERT
jgi:crossover junction endodeoxyribonuclease RusA